MDPIVSAPLVVLLTTLLDGMSLYGVCCVSLGEKPTWKDGLLFVGIIFLLERAAHPFLGDGYSGFAYLMCFVLTLLQARFAFHRRGRCLWIATGISLLAQFGFVLVVGPVCLWIFGAACQCHDRQLRLGPRNTEPCPPGDSLPVCRASLPSTPPVAAASCQIVSLSVSLQGFSFIGRGFCLRLYAFQSAHAAG